MASFKGFVDPAFLKTLGKLSEVEVVAPKMVDEAMPIINSKLQMNASMHHDTGEMADSINPTKAKKAKTGAVFAISRPTGTTVMRKQKVRNAAKLAYLEFGTSEQAATPIVTQTINDTEQQVLNSMQETFNKEMGMK